MKLRNTIAVLLVALPVAGAPQGLEGLDLSAPRKSQPAPLPPPSDDEEALPPTPGEPAEARPVEKAVAQPQKKEEARKEQADLLALPEGDVALGDRVKAVQRKGFLKRHRLEATPLFSSTVNDAFYQKVGGGLRLAYNLGDSFAVGARYTTYGKLGSLDMNLRPIRTDNVREGKVAFQSQLLKSEIDQLAMLDGMWSPVYGKAAWLGSSIVHFDLYLTAGFGAVWSATSYSTNDRKGLGPHIAADLGAGLRFYPLEWMAVEAGMMLTLYPDQPVETVPGTLQKVLAANLGVSFFFPWRFEYVYP
ncbi:MAG TPA: outer membrane beta-barrel domain-containing protein [Anaeromyxobacteraceae bacterium]|nr:outer membrane beta-barrel domain-containing protein [Anaeromyxobacteraceae bacterium]